MAKRQRSEDNEKQLPDNLPQHFQHLTESQTRAVVEWLVSLPLRELRKRQENVAQQISWFYDDQYYHRDTPVGTHVREGMKHLYVQQKHIDVAIQVQHFEGGVLTDEMVSHLMWYQAEVAKQPLKPHVDLPTWLA